MAAVTTFLLCILIGPCLIQKLKHWRVQEKTRRDDCPHLGKYHDMKEGTPTMGGILIVGSMLFSALLWTDLSNHYVLITMFTCIWLAILGIVDDSIKLAHSHEQKEPLHDRRKSDKVLRLIREVGAKYSFVAKRGRRGLSAKSKLLWQLLLGSFIGSFVFFHPDISTKLDIPFFKNISITLGLLYIPFVVLIVVGSSNAVNLTDGLDGLAIGCVLIVSLTLGILSYITGNVNLTEYLFIPYVAGAGELTVICAAMVGASLGFLWFNCHPASIFMGDVGSLALGGTLGAITVFIKKELLLILLGGVFVAEALSVILQVVSFRTTGKRLFKVSPLHHHFQLTGWNESKIIVRFWIVAIILALLTLTTLKIR
jgi:phospho-N-acetylmuramoyl-pentapeptide-transferase